jgi:hypothetical protein
MSPKNHGMTHRANAMAFVTLDNGQAKELWRLSGFYWREALKCEQANAYLAGCAMIGSALEVLLMLMVDCHPEEAEATGKLPKEKGKTKPLHDWILGDLLAVAKAANWLPTQRDLRDTSNRKRPKIGDYAELVRAVRNLIHPSRYLTDHYRCRVTKRYLARQFDIAMLCRDWLVHHNNERLIEDMKKDGIW